MLFFFSHISKQRALCPWRKRLPLNYTPNSSCSKSKLQSVHNKDNSICALWFSHFLLAHGDFPFICAWLWKFSYGWMMPSTWLCLFLCGTLTHWFQCSGFEMVSWRMGDHGWSLVGSFSTVCGHWVSFAWNVKCLTIAFLYLLLLFPISAESCQSMQ